MRTSFLLFLFAVVVMAGCKSTSTSTNGSTTTIVTPGAGSYFTMVDITTDSTGAVVSSDTTVETFVATGLTYGGKTNVIELIDSQDGIPTDTGYLHYESDGDVSTYVPSSEEFFGSVSGWWTIPFSSQQKVTIKGDTASNGTSESLSIIFQGAGSGSITIMGQSVYEEKVSSILDDTVMETLAGRTIYSDTTTENLGTSSFAPSLGEEVESSTPGTRDPITGVMGNSDHHFVINYVLK
jgi:hypothetical protein